MANEFLDTNYNPAISNGAKYDGSKILDDSITTSKLADGTQFTATVDSNGTTAVSVFGSAGLSFPIVITGVSLVALDTTATNITVEAPASTVVTTIAKGVTAGALVGGVTLANTSVPAGTNVIVDGSSTGLARVTITYTKA